MGSLQDIISSVRNLRSEMNLNPGAKVPLIIQGKAMDFTNFVPYIEALAKISEVKLVKVLDSNNTSPIAIVNGVSLMLEVEIDIASEKERLAKEIEKNGKELEKIKLKLNNPAFVDRAPKDLVSRDKDRAHELEQVIKQLEQQIAKLG